jgi:hypothetical protein
MQNSRPRYPSGSRKSAYFWKEITGENGREMAVSEESGRRGVLTEKGGDTPGVMKAVSKWVWIFVAGLPVLLGGCAALPFLPGSSSLLPSGSANADFHSGTAVRLEQANFTTVKTNVVGQTKGFALLGIITLVPARFSTAMDRLYGHAEVRPGAAQTLANVVVERSSTYLILYSIPRVSIRADVVEFVRPSTTNLAQPFPFFSGRE